MSYADKVFRSIVEDILENGTDTKNEKVRPHWPDGSPAYTIKQFGVANMYDLRKEFPACTFRKTALKSCMDEILWIYQKKSNNINDLKPHIWDEWADKDGSIGKAYGYQVGVKNQLRKWESEPVDSPEKVATLERPDQKFLPNIDIETMMVREIEKDGKQMYVKRIMYSMDQMDAVLFDLKFTPFSRRIKINLYNMGDLHSMNLQPCCYDLTFNVTVEDGYDKPILNLQLNQRSQDMLAANNWNTCQYAILLMMIAQASDMIPGRLFHVITDCHIYDRHVDLIKELVNREVFPAPKVWLNPVKKDFYSFTTDDLIVRDYQYGPQVKDIPIAI